MISRRDFLQQTTLSSLGVIASSSFIDPASA
ncbi:twin-arginine translocation signal domain-containing protein [Segetibacter aerophilus]|nr:twin-arginine translocation signal domain-containing protein [Segetibacter aerophilus]